MNIKKYRVEIVILLAGAVIAGGIIAADSLEPKKTIPNVAVARKFENARPIAPKTEILRGNPDASLFIVEYGDLQCRYCREEHPHLKKYFRTKRALDGTVAWIFRAAPHIDTISDQKAETLFCVHLLYPDETVWKFIDQSLLVTKEKKYPHLRYESIFEDIGVDSAAIAECRKNKDAQTLLQQANADVDALEITRTPALHFVSNENIVLTQTEGIKTFSEIHGITETILETLGIE